MSTIALPQPTIPTADPMWIRRRSYRMTVEQYEAHGGLGAFQEATGSISSTDTWWRR